jgi:hypothetical protein
MDSLYRAVGVSPAIEARDEQAWPTGDRLQLGLDARQPHARRQRQAFGLGRDEPWSQRVVDLEDVAGRVTMRRTCPAAVGRPHEQQLVLQARDRELAVVVDRERSLGQLDHL